MTVQQPFECYLEPGNKGNQCKLQCVPNQRERERESGAGGWNGHRMTVLMIAGCVLLM